jgi:hypothetical protein
MISRMSLDLILPLEDKDFIQKYLKQIATIKFTDINY